jgi:hypothetical protein
VSATQRIVDEGLLIALSAVRMAVKNHIIVGALREHTDYHESEYAAVAKDELTALAHQNEEDAERVGGRRKHLSKSRWTHELTEDQRHDLGQLARRRRMHKRLAKALLGVADDDEQVARLVDEAQHDASHEIRKALAARLIGQTVDRRERNYERLRAARIQDLVRIDLAALLPKRNHH